MDPNTALQELLDLARATIATSTDESALRLADQIIDMHEWCSKGGFFPAAWVTHSRQNMDRGESRSGL